MSVCYIWRSKISCSACYTYYKELPKTALLWTQQSGAGLSDMKGVAGRASEDEGGFQDDNQSASFPFSLAGWPCLQYKPSIIIWSILVCILICILISLRHSQLLPISIFSTSRQEIPRGGWFMVDCALLLLLLSTLEIPVHEGSSPSACCHQ